MTRQEQGGLWLSPSNPVISPNLLAYKSVY